MTVKTIGIAVAAAALLSTVAAAQAPRDNIWSVGSSTVFPYTQAVSEEFGYDHASPNIESTGTGGGMRLFCGGIGLEYADIAGASRAMKQSEWDLCNRNGVTDISEIQIGSDGLSFAVSRRGASFNVTRSQLFLALASEVPVNGEIVANPNVRWSDIDPALPNVAIQVFGPPPTSGTRDAWIELVMEVGCATFPEVEALSDDRKAEVCQRMRTDGAFIEAGENDNLIVQRLNSDPTAYGIFGYSFLYENQDTLQPVLVEGVAPDATTIEDGSYPISRPLFFYVKNAHRAVMPDLQAFLELYTSEDSMGPDGFLTERGLVPLSDERREQERNEAVNGVQMSRYVSN